MNDQMREGALSEAQQRVLVRAKSKEGALAIFREGPFLCQVQVCEVRGDVEGIHCLIRGVAAPGMSTSTAKNG